MEVFKIIDKAIVKNIDLQKFNFSHLNYMYDYNTGIFYKETETKIDVLSYGFNYDYRDNDPISISHENFVPWITFKNVEKILNFVLYNLYETKQITNAHNFYVNNQKTLFIDEPMINEDAFIYELYKDKQYLEQNILKSTESAEILIKNHFFSFFENFSTLQDINDKIIEKYEWQQWNKFFLRTTILKLLSY
ncbi:hypothetical protein ACQ9BO_12175 [Flavobacterium sp. P21]|uniref:hypothetical protein n=1 Tax=Flavobacterium sp. P21 TaxID=3423948 RepID=UPI003D67B49B